VLSGVEPPGDYMYQVDENVEQNESELPRLTVQGLGSFSLPLLPRDAATLLAAASAAPFGQVTARGGSATRTDAAVRRALQIDQARVSFSADFHETLRGITAGEKGLLVCAMLPMLSVLRHASCHAHGLSRARHCDRLLSVAVSVRTSCALATHRSCDAPAMWRQNLPPRTDVAAGLGEDESAGVEARLYKLLIYEPGGHFLAHRDTEKEPGMFATLLICLPVVGGHQVSHGGGLGWGHASWAPGRATLRRACPRAYAFHAADVCLAGRQGATPLLFTNATTCEPGPECSTWWLCTPICAPSGCAPARLPLPLPPLRVASCACGMAGRRWYGTRLAETPLGQAYAMRRSLPTVSIH
jgi:hypothetical protein